MWLVISLRFVNPAMPASAGRLVLPNARTHKFFALGMRAVSRIPSVESAKRGVDAFDGSSLAPKALLCNCVCSGTAQANQKVDMSFVRKRRKMI